MRERENKYILKYIYIYIYIYIHTHITDIDCLAMLGASASQDSTG